MGLVTGPNQGETTELKISKQARHRLVAGLSWDPVQADEIQKEETFKQVLFDLKQVAGSLKMMLTEKHYKEAISKHDLRLDEKLDKDGREKDDPYFDLDLMCLIYNRNKDLAVRIDPASCFAIDESEKVYHSDDEQYGLNLHDDEQIHVEFKDLPEDYHHIFFVVVSDCKHNLKEVLNPVLRIADSSTEQDILRVKIDELILSDNFGYVCCHIFRDGDTWKIKNISEFTDDKMDWNAHLKGYI
jgi:stress response protein SCP2